MDKVLEFHYSNAGVGRSKKEHFLCALKNIFKDKFFKQKKIRR